MQGGAKPAETVILGARARALFSCPDMKRQRQAGQLISQPHCFGVEGRDWGGARRDGGEGVCMVRDWELEWNVPFANHTLKEGECVSACGARGP